MMVRGALVLAVVIPIACLTGCMGKDPRAVRITEANKENFIEQIKDLKGLTVDEGRMLFGFILRHKMATGLGQEPPSVVGKTVGDLIADQRTFEIDAKKREADQARLAAEAKAKEDALAAELKKAINLTVFEKDYVPSNAMARRYQDYITIECVYENTSAKDIRAFTGSVRFTDLFDKPVFESSITISDPIKAGTKDNWSGSVEYNQFNDSHKAFRNAALADLKIVWLPRSVLFADGTKIGAPE